MPSFTPSFGFCLSAVIVLALLSSPALAFGAGNIASAARIEGQNWRHGDIEDTLLNLLMSRAAGGKKFGKLDVKRVYFGNWLRDYSQAVDVGTVKYVSAEAIRIILWVLGFMSFGYGTKEFEVTSDRLGCYRPEEHIDNPKDYADNIDARQYDRRLRGPVDERRELAVNPQTGLKNYIATENIGITTSAGLVRNLFGRSIQLGRQYARTHNKADLYEALRLLGTGCHCLEDYSAHSNYTELSLIELGERGVFPHVGRQTQMNLPRARQPVYPIITGTFGGVDFLHSVMGEFSDKATQSEIQELEGTMQSNSVSNPSLLQDLLNQVPAGLFGGKDQAGKADELQANAQAAQMQNMNISPRQPEAWTRQLQEVSKQIMPIIEWHDEIMQSISETIEQIPILPDLIEQLEDQINIFVFSLLAPFVVPIINQVKTELATGSSEIIQSSKEKQLIVFRDDRSTNPTHSMLSKDHFSNILNEPAGKVASQVLKWVVPQLIACWDDERIDIDRTLNRIVNGVFHHPALRDYGDDGAVDGRRLMFGVVQQWWGSKDERERSYMRDQLSRDGVEQGRNHKEGVHDSGHGCGKPLGMPTSKTAESSGAIGGLAPAAILGGISSALGGETSSYTVSGGNAGTATSGGFGNVAAETVGGGALGGIVGGLVGGLGGDLLGDAFGGSTAEKKQGYQKQNYGQDGSFTQSVTETGYSQPQYGREQVRYGQAEYSQTQFPGGGQRQEYQRYQQDDQSGRQGYGGYGEQVIQESRPMGGGGYEQRTETRFEGPDGKWQSEVQVYGKDKHGKPYKEEKYHEGRDRDDKSSDDSDDGYSKHKKDKHKKKHGKRDSSDEDEEKPYRAQGSAYGAPQRTGYGQEQTYGAGRREEYSQGYAAPQTQEYSRFQEPARPSYDTPSYGRNEEYGRAEPEFGRERFGREEPSYGQQSSGRSEPAYEREEEPAYGAGRFGHDEPAYSRGGFGEEREEPAYGRGEEYERQEEPVFEGGEGRGYGGGYGEEYGEERRY